jgi:protein SCO1/2
MPALEPVRRHFLVELTTCCPARRSPRRDESLLEGKEPGDLVTATLIVEEVDAYLSALIKTGHAAIDAPLPAPVITDADLLKPGDAVPDVALVDQDGTPRPLSSLRGHRVALTFVYTRCPLPDFCPLMDRHFTAVQRTIAATPSLADAKLLTVTLDPEFDTPPVLKAHARAVGADGRVWHFATGAPGDVAAFARRFGVIAERQGEDPASLTHNLRTAVIDPGGRLHSIVSGNQWTPAELVADLHAAPAPAN